MNQHEQFERLLQRHRGIVYKVAGSFTRTASDRDDLAQEICLQLWRAFPTHDAQRKFSTWMYRVALNVAISQARRAASRRPEQFEALELFHLETVGAEDDGEQQAQLDALQAFISQLEPLNRALMLLYLDDHSYADMAAVLGISETNVATKISRIKNSLRSMNHGTR
jgi:RNA polymerase sigma factor (sigma-70 family)